MEKIFKMLSKKSNNPSLRGRNTLQKLKISIGLVPRSGKATDEAISDERLLRRSLRSLLAMTAKELFGNLFKLIKAPFKIMLFTAIDLFVMMGRYSLRDKTLLLIRIDQIGDAHLDDLLFLGVRIVCARVRSLPDINDTVSVSNT